MGKKIMSVVLALSMILSMCGITPMAVATEQPAAVFADGDLDNVYFAGDTLTFNLTGIPVGAPPAGIPAGTTLRVSFGTVGASNEFSAFTLFNTLSNGMGDGTGWYAERTLTAGGSLSSSISGQIVATPVPPMGAVAVKLYVFNGVSWQNVLQGQTPDFIVLSAGSNLATVGLDGVLEVPDGVTSVPIIGAGAQNVENLRNIDIRFSKSIADGITGSIHFTGLNLLDSSAQSQLSGLEDGLIMQKIVMPSAGAVEQYIMGVNVAPGGLSFLAEKGATVSVSSPSFSGLSDEKFSAAAADVAGGVVSDLSFNDATNTVSFTVNHFSNYILSVLEGASELFYEDFESYEENAYPSSFTLQYGGTGNGEQKVITTVGPNDQNSKVFRLQGAHMWSSEQFLSLPAELPQVLIADAYIKPVSGSWPGEISFRNLGVGPWGTRVAAVWFGDGKILAIQNGNDGDTVEIGDFSYGQWYHIALETDLVLNTFNVYINGIKVAEDLPAHPTVTPATLSLIAGNIGTNEIYFDNVGLFSDISSVAFPPYASDVSIAGTPLAGETLTGEYTFNGGTESGTAYRWLENSGSETELFNTMNINGVINGPTSPAEFVLTEKTFIARIENYHWNGGAGAAPGTISLRRSGGSLYGPWNAVGLYGNLYWEVLPNIELPPGTYTVIDSSNETWAHNDESGYRGMTVVYTNNYNDVYTPITGATESSYVLTSSDVGKKIKFEVTVRDSDGISGSAVSSAAVGPVTAEEPVITHWIDEISSLNQYPFGGGDGSTADLAYEISTPLQLAQLAYNVNNNYDYTSKYFRLMNDIDLSGKEWTPIGYRFYPGYERGFNGNFDGNNNSITNLAIGKGDQPAPGGIQTQAGLFGAIKYLAEIKNIHISGEIYVNDVASVGMLVGNSESDGTISGCSAAGIISSNGQGDVRIGGLIGETSGTTVINCSSAVDIAVLRPMAVGGLIGYHGAFTYDRIRPLDGCVFSGSLVSGNVPGYGGVGGIAGKSYGYTIILNSINKGSVAGAEGNIGGIVGIQHNEGIINCYTSGSVYGDGDSSSTNVGGITGFIDAGRVYNCYVSGLVTADNTALAGALVGFGSSGSNVASCYFDRTVNPELFHVRSTQGNKSYLPYLSTQIMKGADPDFAFEYAQDAYADGDYAILTALNGWIELNQPSYPAIAFNNWGIAGAFNDGYPYLTGTETPGAEHDATLLSLTVPGVTLSPGFSPLVSNYTANVSNSTTTAAITVAPSNGLATVNINGDNTLTKTVSLNVGSNLITIQVTAEDGTTTRTYNIAITRATGSVLSSSSYASPAIVVTTDKIGSFTANSIMIDPNNISGSASAYITGAMVQALLDKAVETGGTSKKDKIVLTLNTAADTKKLAVSIPQQELNKIASATDANFALESSFVSISFDGKAVQTISGASSGGSVEITAERLADFNGRPVYDFTVANGGKTVSDFNGGHATVTVPYVLKPGENPNAVVIYHLTANGVLKPVRGHYNAELKAVVFKTTHFSKFTIIYNPVIFSDIPEQAWYKNAVDFIAAHSITSGTGNNKFSPKANLTRAQFIVLLMNAYQISTDAGDSNFTDAGDTYYTSYLAAAKGLGIVRGTGNNLFAPDKEITRQEMFVMLYNALMVIDELPATTDSIQLSGFDDAKSAAGWANEALSYLIMSGIVKGYNNRLYPTATTTRAEMAQVLYSLMSK